MDVVERRAREEPTVVGRGKAALTRVPLYRRPPPRRWTIQRLLVECGMDRTLVYGPHSQRVKPLFARGWEDRLLLDGLAADVRRAWRAKVKRVRPDLPGDGDKRRLDECKARLARWFDRRGVRL